MNKLDRLTRTRTKIGLISAIIVLLFSCNVVKRVPDGEYLLTENTIVADSVEVTDSGIRSQLQQKPNPRIPLIGVPMGVHIYNLADPKPDSTFQAWLNRKPKREERLIRFLSKKQVDGLDSSYVNFNKWLQRTGSKPVVIDRQKAERSTNRLVDYYASYGWFNAEASYEVIPDTTKEKRAEIKYTVQKYEPYFVDDIEYDISSPVVDSLFQETKNQSFVVSGKQFENNDFANERERLTIQFRNSGLFHFDQEYVTFDADTVNTGHKANVKYIIPDRQIEEGDSVRTEPFKVHTISEVRVVTDYTYANRNEIFQDSATHKKYKLYSYDNLKYRPKAITDAISIVPDSIFKDIDRTLTYNSINNLNVFKYPTITYTTDPRDTTGTDLIATILLAPKKKFTIDASFDTYTSTIQQFGIGFSGGLLIRNVFRGAETLQISGNGSVGSSKDAADDTGLFNISEFGGNVKLSIPRIVFPTNTSGLIKKYMSPSTNISVGFSAQNNIGLDRQTTNFIYNYEWEPSKIRTNSFDLINIQFVRNLNPENYFNVYRSSFDLLNDIAQQTNWDFNNPDEDPRLEIPDETNDFITSALLGEPETVDLNSDELQTVLGVAERRARLTENNLIFASNFVWTRDTRENIFDRNFSRLRWKLESAGNLLSAIGSLTELEVNENGNEQILGVAYSQYAKGEVEYIKHWDFGDDYILAMRTFTGIAIPYGNSNSIPFTRSYFAGGANDNRGWRAYELGPGSSGGLLEFNEANFKLAFNIEQRFAILGAFKGAIFADIGNIWNVFDNTENEAFTFDGVQDLKELAVGTGIGFRYDFAFAVLRLDIGFKAHNPGLPEGERWFTDFNFRNAVYNIGINYPF